MDLEVMTITQNWSLSTRYSLVSLDHVLTGVNCLLEIKSAYSKRCDSLILSHAQREMTGRYYQDLFPIEKMELANLLWDDSFCERKKRKEKIKISLFTILQIFYCSYFFISTVCWESMILVEVIFRTNSLFHATPNIYASNHVLASNIIFWQSSPESLTTFVSSYIKENILLIMSHDQKLI